MRLPLRLIAAQATYFLCFAKESKQRKATPTCRSASQTSLTPHPFFGACELVALRGPSDNARLFPKKECCVRLDVGEWAVASSVCDGLTKKGSLKTGKWFSGYFIYDFAMGEFRQPLLLKVTQKAA